MKFVCANADLIQNINLDTDYDYITASSKSIIMAVETLANSFAKSKSDCVLFVWNTSDPADLVRATEEACVEDVNFKKIIDDLEKNLDYSILGDFDLESIELENGMTISVVKYVTMNNFIESKESARKSMKESKSSSILDDEFYDLIEQGYIYDEDENGMNMSYGEYSAVSDDLWETLENELKYYRDFPSAYDAYNEIMNNTSDDAKMFMGVSDDDYFYFEINEDEGTYSFSGEVPSVLEKLFKEFQKETDLERV